LKSKHLEYLLVLILSCAFTRGLMRLVGIPTIIPKSIMEFSILSLFAWSLSHRCLTQKKPARIPGALLMPCLFGISVLSFIQNEQPILAFLLFLRNVFVYYLLFVALLNVDFSESSAKRINKYLVFLFLIQIPAGLAKYAVMGIREGGPIGTVCVNGGNYSTTLPLFAIAFLSSFLPSFLCSMTPMFW